MSIEVSPQKLVGAYNFRPLRAKSAFVRLPNDAAAAAPVTRAQAPAPVERPVSQYKFHSQSLNSFSQPSPVQPLNNNTSTVAVNTGSPVNFDNLSQPVQPIPTPRKANFDTATVELAKDYQLRQATERLVELERTNLNLKRMLQLIATDPINNAAKLLPNRPKSSYKPALATPRIRQGRIGSSWRHIKQTNNYSGSNLLFIDGTVRIDDSSRYPPKQFGYPPKIRRDIDEEFLGLTTQSLNDLSLPIAQQIRHKQANIHGNENVFHDHAKQGFEYWLKDKRNPDNNKPKAKQYTTGSYKTFFGLSAAPLKL